MNEDQQLKDKNKDNIIYVKNENINSLIEEKKITNQGNKTGESSEGMWFNYSDVVDALIQIKTNEELFNYVNSI